MDFPPYFKDGEEYRITVHAAKHQTREEWIPSSMSVRIPRGDSLDVAGPFVNWEGETYKTKQEAYSAGYEIVKRKIDSGEIR